MRNTKFIAAALAGGFILTASALPATARYRNMDNQYRVVGVDGGSTLAMHSRPSNYSRTIRRIPFNARYLIETGSRRNGRWVRIRYDGRSGWVVRRRLARDDGGRTYFRATGLGRNGKLQIHARPWHNSRVRGAIYNNTRFIVDLGKCRGNWCKVKYDGVRGWVEKHCLITMRRTDPGYGRDRYSNRYWRERNDRLSRYGSRRYRSFDRVRRWNRDARRRNYRNISTLGYYY